jgi:hypothetical protein
VQRYLSTVVVVINLCDTMAIHLKTGKSAGNPSFDELLMTSHYMARCGPLYPSSASLCNSLPLYFKILNTSLSMYSFI